MMPADPKKRLALLVSIAAAALLLLVYTLWGGSRESATSLAAAPATAPATVTAPPPVNAPVAGLMPGGSAPPPPATPVAAPVTGTVEGLRLHGVTSGAAIIGLPNGRQRLVRIGQEVQPGVTLQDIGQQHATLQLSSGPVRLTFSGPETAGPAGATVSTAQRQVQASRAEERRYLLGTQPRADRAGRVTGYVVRRAADVPLLQQAGLRDGDVLLSVNGQAIDGQERLTQIPAELSGASTAQIEYERAGRRTTATVQLRRR